MERLAIWQTQLVAEEIAAERGADLDHAGDEAADLAASPEVAKEAASRMTAMVDDLEPLLVYVWRRQLTAAINRGLNDAPGADGLGAPRVIGFADLVNFTAVVRRPARR